jgi:predicted hotdog family 3-hydroxylacyl-ACP dehydratase
MVLVDAVEWFNATEIVCAATSHTRGDNPLRREGILPVYAAIEYAAQAIAIHATLTTGGVARAGVLGSVRRFRAHIDRLDQIHEPIHVYASLRQAEATSAVYTFSVRARDQDIAGGQAAVFFEPEPR